jgi:hypothetical protein
MNVQIEAEATQFPEKEYINGIAVAVQCLASSELLTPPPPVPLVSVFSPGCEGVGGQ